MKTYLALVRHGVTDWNYDGRAQGHTDIPLNDEGRRQAEAVAVRLAAERWDAIYSSDLSRARDTALAIARRTGHEVITDVRLRERLIGLAEGTTPYERKLRWPGVAWQELPGIENDEQLARRGLAVLKEIAERHAGQRVIVVSHGGLIGAVLRAIAGEGAYTVIQRNTGITPVIYDGEFAPAGPQEFRHLLVGGVEYTGEKGRLLYEAGRSGLPGLRLAPEEIDPFICNASAVESAWVNDRLVGYLRTFTDKVRVGYIDVIHVLPEYQHVRSVLLQRLEQRFPAVRFDLLGQNLAERSGA